MGRAENTTTQNNAEEKIGAQTENPTERQKSNKNVKTKKNYRTDETTIKMDEFGLYPLVK